MVRAIQIKSIKVTDGMKRHKSIKVTKIIRVQMNVV